MAMEDTSILDHGSPQDRSATQMDTTDGGGEKPEQNNMGGGGNAGNSPKTVGNYMVRTLDHLALA